MGESCRAAGPDEDETRLAEVMIPDTEMDLLMERKGRGEMMEMMERGRGRRSSLSSD